MTWVDLVWWVWKRGIISGAVEGALLGTLIAPIIGTVYGALYGLLIGAGLGLLNGLSLAVITFLFLSRERYNPLFFIGCVMLVAIPVDVVLVMQVLGNWLGPMTALLVSLTAAYYSFGYVDFVQAQSANIKPRKTSVKVLS